MWLRFVRIFSSTESLSNLFATSIASYCRWVRMNFLFFARFSYPFKSLLIVVKVVEVFGWWFEFLKSVLVPGFIVNYCNFNALIELQNL